MRMPHVRFTARWVVAAVILVAIMVALATIEVRECLRSDAAVAKAEMAYQDAKLAREFAEVAAKEYAEGIFRQELAIAEDDIKAAEDDLKRIRSTAAADLDWAERIRSKGYLLMVPGGLPKELRVKRATFEVEIAKSKRDVLVRYTKCKTLKELNNQVAKASENERAKRAAYDRVRAAPVGFIGKLIRRK